MKILFCLVTLCENVIIPHPLSMKAYIYHVMNEEEGRKYYKCWRLLFLKRKSEENDYNEIMYVVIIAC